MLKQSVLIALILGCAAPAQAAEKLEMHGLVLGSEGARYAKGVATLDLQQRRGAMQIRYLGLSDNRPVFAVAVFNGSNEPMNIAPENIHAVAAGSPLRIFTTAELERQAKRKAWWTQFGLALAGGLGAASAASTTNTYRSTLLTPYGAYYGTTTGPSLAGQLQAYQMQRDTAVSMALVQQRLDAAIDKINNQVVQRTTIDPGSSYAGLVVLDKFKVAKPPFELRLSTDWNGERYDFGFLVQKTGLPVPEQYRSMLAVNAKPKAMTNQLVNIGEATPGGSTVQGRASSGVVASSKPSGAIVLRSGLIKVPAKTPSGYCAIAPDDYVATGNRDYPVISGYMPRCPNGTVP